MAITTLSRPSEPVLARSRQQWVIQSSGHEALDRYRVRCRILQEDGRPLIELVQAPDSLGRTYFELSDCVDAALTYYVPLFGSPSIQEDKEAAQVINAFFVETWLDGAGIEQSNSLGSIFWGLKGGLGHSMQAYNYPANLTNGTKFLAWTGRGMKVDPAQQLFLSWYMQLPPSDLRLRVYRQYQDGTPEDNYLADDFGDTSNEHLYVLPVGYEALNVALGAAGPVASYEVQVFSIEEGLNSERYRFTLAPEPAKKTFLFANSLGGWQVFFCWGNWEETADIRVATVEQNVPIGNSPEEAQYVTTQAPLRNVLRASSGYLVKGSDPLRHALECVQSRAVYEVQADRFVPINISGMQVRTNQSMPGLIAVQFEYRYAFENAVYDGPTV